MEIIGHLQNYEWGKTGTDSLVAQIYSSSVEFKIDDGTPYAELWMGIHNNGEAKLKSNMQPLSEWLKSHKTSQQNCQQFLPFLFKVLSVNKALSIQCHPNQVSMNN